MLASSQKNLQPDIIRVHKHSVLIIFSKVPEAGKVKTRLIEQFGKSYSATIYRRLFWNTLAKATQADVEKIQLYIEGDQQHPELIRIVKHFDIEILQQQGQHLGERMHNALTSAFVDFEHAVLIGCDCIALTVDDINLSIQSLQDSSDVVIGPAEDGGYYLIGMNQPQPELFKNIIWGSESVFSETMSRVEQNRIQYKLLNNYKDVDISRDVETELFGSH